MSVYQIKVAGKVVTEVTAESGHEALSIYRAGSKIHESVLTASEKPLVLPHDEDGVSAVGSTKIVGYRATCRCHGAYWRGPVQDERVFAQGDLKTHREEFQS